MTSSSPPRSRCSPGLWGPHGARRGLPTGGCRGAGAAAARDAAGAPRPRGTVALSVLRLPALSMVPIALLPPGTAATSPRGVAPAGREVYKPGRGPTRVPRWGGGHAWPRQAAAAQAGTGSVFAAPSPAQLPASEIPQAGAAGSRGWGRGWRRADSGAAIRSPRTGAPSIPSPGPWLPQPGPSRELCQGREGV